MTTSATPGYGTLLKMGDGGTPEVFTTVAEVINVQPPKIAAGEADVTSHDSSGWEESIPTLLSGGEIPVEVNWLPSNATQNETTGLIYVLMNRVKKNWKVVLPGSAKTFSFAAWVKDFEGSTPLDEAMKASFTLKVSGAVTIS